MKNVIAVIWDCDKTLIDGYMQDPMFAEYGVETKQFWADENKILDEYQKTVLLESCRSFIRGRWNFSGKQKTCSEMMRVIRNMIFR